MKKRVIFIVLLVSLALISIVNSAPPDPRDSGLPGVPDMSGTEGQDLENISQASCDDNEKNQDETDIDCGGSCDPCQDYESCNISSDCISGYCNSAKRCMAPTCTDSIQNGDETGVDCGESCSACSTGSGNTGRSSSTTGWGYGPDENYNADSNTNTRTTGSASTTHNTENEQQTYTQEEVQAMIDNLSPKSSNKLFISSLIINALLIVGLVVLVVNKNQTAKTIQKQTDPNVERLKAYIQGNMQQGYHPQQIRDFLLSQNWPQETVEEAFNSIRW